MGSGLFFFGNPVGSETPTDPGYVFFFLQSCRQWRRRRVRVSSYSFWYPVGKGECGQVTDLFILKVIVGRSTSSSFPSLLQLLENLVAAAQLFEVGGLPRFLPH